jgi:uncharacterized protein
MKLQPDRIDTLSVTGYGPGWIVISGEKVTRSVVMTSLGEQFDWDCDHFSELSPAHFARLADLSVELVIFGSGDQLRFIQPAWASPLMQRGVGLETMDTFAACRTFNILAGEGRKVAAALVIEAQ